MRPKNEKSIYVVACTVFITRDRRPVLLQTRRPDSQWSPVASIDRQVVQLRALTFERSGVCCGRDDPPDALHRCTGARSLYTESLIESLTY